MRTCPSLSYPRPAGIRHRSTASPTLRLLCHAAREARAVAGLCRGRRLHQGRPGRPFLWRRRLLMRDQRRCVWKLLQVVAAHLKARATTFVPMRSSRNDDGCESGAQIHAGTTTMTGGAWICATAPVISKSARRRRQPSSATSMAPPRRHVLRSTPWQQTCWPAAPAALRATTSDVPLDSLHHVAPPLRPHHVCSWECAQVLHMRFTPDVLTPTRPVACSHKQPHEFSF